MEIQIKQNTKIGIASKCLIITSIIFYVSTYFNTNFKYIFSNIPLFSLFGYEIYRLISAIFTTENLFELIVNISIILTIINLIENKEGTVKTIIKLVISAIVLQTLIILVYVLIRIVHPFIMIYKIKPLFLLGIAFLSKHILKTEDKYIQTFYNLSLNNRFLLVGVIILGQLSNLLEFKLIEIVIAIYYGFLTCKLPLYLDYSPSEEEILHFEKNENYKFWFTLNGWISVEECYFKTTNNISNDDLNEINTDIETRKESNFSTPILDIESTEQLDLADNTDPNLVILQDQNKISSKEENEYIDLS